MTAEIKISVLERQPPDVTVREWRTIRKTTHGAMGAEWYETMLPLHFLPTAAARYRYRRRSAVYRDLKRENAGRPNRKVGGQPVAPDAPVASLVLSGRLRAVTTQGVRDIRSYPTRFVVRFPSMVYVPKRRRTDTQPPIAEELTRTTRDERRQLMRTGRRVAVEQIQGTREARSRAFS